MDPSDVTTTLSEAFGRLRWPVFESVHNVRVFGDTGDRKLDKLNALPFDGHPIGEQAATNPPFRKITIDIDVLEEYAAVLNDYWPGEEEFEMPEPLSVRPEDHGIVTIRDVVEQLSPYFITHKDIILQAKSPLLSWRFRDLDVPPDTRVFFTGFTYDTIEAGDRVIPVELWAEGEFRETVEKRWGPD